MARVCGNCAVCCVATVIPELKKPAHVPCAHLVGDGVSQHRCSIYADPAKPKACSVFRCAWLDEPTLGDGCRPDRLGVMIVRYALSASPEHVLVVIGEAQMHALQRREVRRIADYYMRRLPTMLRSILSNEPDRLAGPPVLVRALVEGIRKTHSPTELAQRALKAGEVFLADPELVSVFSTDLGSNP